MQGRRKLSEVLGLPKEDILASERLPDSVHIFSHVEWHMTGYRVKMAKEHPELFHMVKKRGNIFKISPAKCIRSVYKSFNVK